MLLWKSLRYLPYPRRLGCKTRKKTLLIGLPVLLVVILIGTIVVPPRLTHSPTETKAVGTWQETDTSKAYWPTIRPDPQATDGVWYSVTYPRSFKVPFPANLAGDEILLEARILAVADVAEAMISHRPYREALPLAAAISELEDGAGSSYDDAACDAAIQLLRGQGFTFAE